MACACMGYFKFKMGPSMLFKTPHVAIVAYQSSALKHCIWNWSDAVRQTYLSNTDARSKRLYIWPISKYGYDRAPPKLKGGLMTGQLRRSSA